MQKLLAITVLVGGLAIAVALVYHGRQLAAVSHRLEAMEQRTTDLNRRLEKFSADLPAVAAQAGNNAGRQAVQGAVDELVQIPMNMLKRKPTVGGSNATSHAVVPIPFADSLTNPGGSWIRFDIREPVVNIEILPNLKEIPAIPWLPTGDLKLSASKSNKTAKVLAQPKPAAKE